MKIWKIAQMAQGNFVTLCKEPIPASVWEDAQRVTGSIQAMNAKGALAYAFKMNANKKAVDLGVFIDRHDFVDWNARPVNPFDERWDGYIILNQDELDTMLKWVDSHIATPEEMLREIGI